MNPIVFALRRPDHRDDAGARPGAGRALQHLPDAEGHLPVAQPAAALRHPQLRRDGPQADRGPDHQRLRAVLSVHQRRGARRVAVDPEHGDAQAVLPAGNRHGRGDGPDRRLLQPSPVGHARSGHCRRMWSGSTRAACRSATWSSRARAARSASSRTWRCSGSGRCSRAWRASRRRPPFGGNIRTIVVNVDPDRLRSYNLSPQDVVDAIDRGNFISPSGNVTIKDQMTVVPTNTMVVRPAGAAQRPAQAGGERLHP